MIKPTFIFIKIIKSLEIFLKFLIIFVDSSFAFSKEFVTFISSAKNRAPIKFLPKQRAASGSFRFQRAPFHLANTLNEEKTLHSLYVLLYPSIHYNCIPLYKKSLISLNRFLVNTNLEVQKLTSSLK